LREIIKQLTIKIITILAILLYAGMNAQEESKIIKNGFYVDTFIGTATTDFTSNNDLGFGVKLGNVWYFGSNEVWRPGVKTVWFRGSAYFGDFSAITIQGSVVNIGFANVFEFTDNIGLEANINVGYNIVYAENDFDDYTGGGIMFNPELKFRYNVLAVGLDMIFTRVNDYDDEITVGGNKIDFSSINLSIGAKF